MPFGFNNVCSLTAVNSKLFSGNPVGQKPANGLAERLNRDYGIVLWVANDIVARYSPAEIEAAIALREKRNGAIYNGAGFIVYLLKNGFAGNYVRARLQAHQRPRKPPDEPDFAGIAKALQEALAPYGITVDDEGFAELPNGRLCLPPDPEKALDLLRRCGVLRDGNGQATLDDRQKDLRSNGENCPSLADDFWAFNAELTNELWASDDLLSSDQYPPDDDAIASLTDWASDKADLPDDGDDEGEPSPVRKCELCKRSEGEPHPSLKNWQRNDFLDLSELSDAFKQRFGLPDCGLLCRGCYVTLCARLANPSKPIVMAWASDDLHNAPADATETTKPDSDFWASDGDGQKDPSDDGENYPST